MVNFSVLSDSELLNLARSGDKDAENALILRYRRLVKAVARPFFLAGGDSEDLQQEGMIGLLSAIREYDSKVGASFHTYAEICVRRRIISAAKSASRRKHAPLNDGVSLDELLSDENQLSLALGPQRFCRGPEDQVLEQERACDFISSYSRHLSAFERTILTHYLDGCSCAEIAARCGRSAKSVDNAIQRIRKKLAHHLRSGDFS